ncbi:ATP-binding cassette domain-containing protein [Chitinophaga sp. Mgbs1]|uniref:ATP-binding cassette domain-containing protein n=2 Tax=Chitinophaga solisilvae TaxID=1233460 RepID=A0A9Q5GRL9_9BACT|nr:ATP-binding cassette domain-containing protein [Chitinophaga solisilvae]
MISGQIPFEGDILFRGISIKRQPQDYRRQIGWAEAEPLFPPFMTGMDLILLHEHIRKADKAATRLLMEQLQLHSFVKGAIGSYSAGMTKRLSLALALIGQPSLVVLDEPVTTLDAHSFTAVSDIILEQQQRGVTFLMSSHQDLDTRISQSQQVLTVVNKSVFN